MSFLLLFLTDIAISLTHIIIPAIQTSVRSIIVRKIIKSAIYCFPELQEAYRDIMKAFYGIMKSQDQYIPFGFITGVTKFSHVSIFSDLNNINDITMDMHYVDVCGISENDLHKVFDDS